MKTPARFKAETKYDQSQDKKANRNLPIMALVGRGAGAAGVTGRPAFYWIRLVADDNRVTQCRSLIPLTNGDVIYVRKARDRKLSHYEFVAFIQDGTGGTAPPVQVHDHSSAVTGGDDLNPETISTHTLVVGTGCPYTTLGAAVAAVPGTPCTIKVLGITTTETAPVTIPASVTVVGQGRGSVIGMGANVLSLSNNSNLLDLAVETTMDDTTKYCVDCNGVTGFELFNVLIRYTPHESGANIAFYFHEASQGAAYHCVADPQAGSATGTVTGFAVEDTANMLLWDCEADDTTNLDDALWIGDAADSPVATTKYCSFHASGNDVNFVATDGTWTYHQDDFDPDHCTVSGIADPADGQEVVYFDCTKTAGAAGDFATVQAAIDWFANRLLCADCKIDIVTSASYAETLVVEDVFCAGEGKLELEGDTRGMAGATWVDGATITCQDANAGAGTCALANAGNNITVTGTGGNPDFDADGWGSGDNCFILDNAGAVTEYTINATLNNVIALTVAAPAVGNNGTAIYLKPNVEIAPAGAGDAVQVVGCIGILLDGLHLDATAGATGNGLCVYEGAHVTCENVGAEPDDACFYVVGNGSEIECEDGACTAIGASVGLSTIYGGAARARYFVAFDNTNGISSQYGSTVDARNAIATVCSSNGFYCSFFSSLRADEGFGIDCDYGFRAIHMGGINANGCSAIDNNGTVGYYAGYMGYVYALNTNANNAGNATDYSPAPGAFPGSAQGNVYGVIYAS